MSDKVLHTLCNYLRSNNRASVKDIKTCLKVLNLPIPDLNWERHRDKLSKEHWKHLIGELLVDRGLVRVNPHNYQTPKESGTVHDRYTREWQYEEAVRAGLQANPGILEATSSLLRDTEGGL